MQQNCQSIIHINSSVPSGYSNIPIVSIFLLGNDLCFGCSDTFNTITFFLYVSVIFIMVPLKPLKFNLLPSLKYDAIISRINCHYRSTISIVSFLNLSESNLYCRHCILIVLPIWCPCQESNLELILRKYL